MWCIVILLGLLLDLCFGDPYTLPHPVRWIGSLILRVEKIVRQLFPNHPKGEMAAGFFLVVIVVFISTAIPWILLYAAYRISPWLSFIFSVVMCYQLFAMKSLKTESCKVYRALEFQNIVEARKAVSMIVGRDTQALSAEGVAKAAVETVAENTSDGVIAPLFYMVLGGPVLGFLYKAVNTMDSMIGYKNETYLYFGRCAARLDDILNYIPARLSGWAMILGAFFCSYDGKNAYRIYKRDRKKHASPNAAQTEAACAGALGLQLAGDAWYFGKLYQKESIGDAKREIEPNDIIRVNRLMYVSCFLAAGSFILVKWFILFIITRFC